MYGKHTDEGTNLPGSEKGESSNDKTVVVSACICG